MSLSYKIIPSRFSIIMLCFSIITLSLLNITFLTGTILGIPISTTSALSYQNSTDVSFTFNPILSISISPDSITIPTIAPGTTATSNIITVNVSTNTAYGYSLLASVGNNTQYNTSDLIHNDSTMGSTFTSIATNASLPTLDTDNTWGYSFSSNHGATWSTYHGLPLYSAVGDNTETNNPALLIDTTSPADSKSIDFRIAARASSTQPSGTYSNVINFYAVGKPQPPTMQNVNGIKSILTNVGDTIQSMDERDGKMYWVAKLADGNIWMTQNLDFDIEAGKTYTSVDTDLQYSTLGTTWTPNVSTSTTSSWTSSYTIPQSYDPGNRYWNGVITTSGGTVESNTTTSGDAHYHIGNYYNWTAAVAINNSSSYDTNYTDVNQSVCPAGWRLPTYSGDKSYDDLVSVQDLTAGTSGNIQNTPTYFVYGGYWHGSSENVGTIGRYWSSVVNDSGYSYQLRFSAHGDLDTQNNAFMGNGRSLRCVMR